MSRFFWACMLIGAIQLSAQVPSKITITKAASVPVETDVQVPVPGTNGLWTFTFMEVNWKVGEAYTTDYSGVNVIDTATWSVKTEKRINLDALDMHPFGMCMSPTTGLLAIPGGLAPSDALMSTPGGLMSSVAIIDPATDAKKKIYLDSTAIVSGICSFSPDGKTLFVGAQVWDPKAKDLTAIKPDTGEVTGAWRVTNTAIPSIQRILAVANEKVYAVSFRNGINVVNTANGTVKRLDLGSRYPIGGMFKAPDGLLYVPVFDGTNSTFDIIDTIGDKVTANTMDWSSDFIAITTANSAYAYMALTTAWLVMSTNNWKPATDWQDNGSGMRNYDMKAIRRNNRDIVVFLRNQRLDVRYVDLPPEPLQRGTFPLPRNIPLPPVGPTR